MDNGEEGKEKAPERTWLGNLESGKDFEIVQSGNKKYLKRAGQFHEIKEDKWGATEVDGIGAVERYKGKITKIGGQKIVGDLGLK